MRSMPAATPTVFLRRTHSCSWWELRIRVPAKSAEFKKIDLPTGLGAISSAKSAGIRHFVYVSVSHPAPMMHAYVAVRTECEAALESTGLNATILRPVVCAGPGTSLAVPLVADRQTC